MLFRRKTASKPPAGGNPFVDAKLEWDDRYDRIVISRRNWQITTVILLVLHVLLSAALIHLASTSRVTPYIVEVDRHGHALAFGPAERLKDPGERVLRRELAVFIEDLRTVHAQGNETAQRKALARLDAHLRQPAAARVADWFSAHNPFAPGRGAVSVDITSVLRLEADLWQVAWTETHFARDGTPLRTEAWQAVVSILIDPPTRSDTMLSNPLGVFVTHVDWTHVPKEKS